MYKISKGMSSPQPYNLRHKAEFLEPFVHSTYCRTESISYIGPDILGIVPDT